MQSWEKWSMNIGGEHGTPKSFPRLHKICIECCPKLVDVSIGLIPSLRVLNIGECTKAMLRSMVGLSSSLVKLKFSRVKGLDQLHGEDLMHLGAVEELYIGYCDELRYLSERDSEACKSLVSLQKLEVRNCKKLVGFGISMESLKQVILVKCDTLESYICPNTIERLQIKSCGSVTSLTFSVVSDCENIEPMSRLTSFRILGCKNLKSFPHEHFQSLTSLEEVEIYDCPSIDYSFPYGLWPPNLSKLGIGGLNKPMSEWGVQNFPTSLVVLELDGKNSGMVSFVVADDVRNTTTTPSSSSSSSSFLLPRSLVSLELKGFKEVESFSEVLQHLPCLKTLNILLCPKIRDIQTTSGPSNLTITVQ